MSDRGKPGSIDERFAGFMRPYLPTLVIVVGAAGCGYWYAANWRTLYVASLRMLPRFGARVDPDMMMGLLAALFFMLGAAAFALAGMLRSRQRPPRGAQR